PPLLSPMMLTMPLPGCRLTRSIDENLTPNGLPPLEVWPVIVTLGGDALSLKTLIEPLKRALSWSPCGTPLTVVNGGRLPLTWMLNLVEGVTLNRSAMPLECWPASSPPFTINPGCCEANAGPACTKLAVLRLTRVKAPDALLEVLTPESSTVNVS